MRVIARSTLRAYWERQEKSRIALQEWYAVVERARWTCFADLKSDFGSADAIGNGRVIFNIKGNHYRLVAIVDFEAHGILIRFVGTHPEYDRIDAAVI